MFQPQLDLGLGLEWAERHLLQRYAPAGAQAHSRTAQALAAVAAIDAKGEKEAGLANQLTLQPLCAGISAGERTLLAGWLQLQHFRQGSVVLHRADLAHGLYFLLRGEVSVHVELPHGGQKRLATLSAGMGCGELALVQGSRRSADLRADTAVKCAFLSVQELTTLQRQHPQLMLRLLHNMVCSLRDTAVRRSAKVAALAG